MSISPATTSVPLATILHDNVHNTNLLLKHGASEEVTPLLNALFHAITFHSIEVFPMLLAHFPLPQKEEGLPLQTYASRLHRDIIIEMMSQVDISSLAS